MLSPDRETEARRLRRGVQGCLALFLAGLVASALTAFPLLAEMRLACAAFGLPPGAAPADYTGLAHWLVLLREALTNTYARYPFFGYATDWFAFGHLMTALFFIAPLREPGRHLGILRVGIVACVLVIPFALIAGQVRGVPLPWRLIDCTLAMLGLVTLNIALRFGHRLNALADDETPASAGD